MSTFRVEYDFSGPFFTKNPGKTVRANIRDLMDSLARESEDQLKEAIGGLESSMKHPTGWTREHIVGRTSSLTGSRWGLHMVISANTNHMTRHDAIRTKAAAAGIERRWHPFRKLASALRSSARIGRFDITKGLE